MDYKTIKLHASEIERTKSILHNLKKLAIQLADSKMDMNISIKILSVLPDGKNAHMKRKPPNNVEVIPGSDIFGKNNVGSYYIDLPKKDMEEDDVRAHFKNQYSMVHTLGLQEKDFSNQVMGFEDDALPNEVALIMLESVKVYYEMVLKRSEKKLHSYLASVQNAIQIE